MATYFVLSLLLSAIMIGFLAIRFLARYPVTLLLVAAFSLGLSVAPVPVYQHVPIPEAQPGGLRTVGEWSWESRERLPLRVSPAEVFQDILRDVETGWLVASIVWVAMGFWLLVRRVEHWFVPILISVLPMPWMVHTFASVIDYIRDVPDAHVLAGREGAVSLTLLLATLGFLVGQFIYRLYFAVAVRPADAFLNAKRYQLQFNGQIFDFVVTGDNTIVADGIEFDMAKSHSSAEGPHRRTMHTGTVIEFVKRA